VSTDSARITSAHINQGFANWAYEVADQEKHFGVFFDTIVVCTVTGSTHAGHLPYVRPRGGPCGVDRIDRAGHRGSDATRGHRHRLRAQQRDVGQTVPRPTLAWIVHRVAHAPRRGQPYGREPPEPLKTRWTTPVFV
jgi:hypothetical protein